MDIFTLLIFLGTDSVAEVRTLRAATVAQARRTAEIIMRTQPAAAGHQLWRNGICVARTYPTPDMGRDAKDACKTREVDEPDADKNDPMPHALVH